MRLLRNRKRISAKFVRRLRNHPHRVLAIAVFILSFACAIMLPPVITGPPQGDTTASARTIEEGCHEEVNEAYTSCLIEAFSSLAQEEPVEYAAQTLVTLQQIDSRARDCHLIAHRIAQQKATGVGAQERDDLLVRVNPSMCVGGFLHGVLEERMAQDGKWVIDGALIQEVCGVSFRNSFGEYSCVHIMGHLLLIQEEADIAAALEVCNQIPASFRGMDCFIGVFMEYTTRVGLLEHGVVEEEFTATAENVYRMEQICFSYKGLMGDACWGEAARLYSEFYKGDLEKVRGSCAQAPTEDSFLSCALFATSSAILTMPTFDEHTVKDLCGPFRTESAHRRCVLTIIGVAANTSPHFIPPLLSYCAHYGDSYEQECFAHVGSTAGYVLSQEERQSLCSQLGREDIRSCERRLFVVPSGMIER